MRLESGTINVLASSSNDTTLRLWRDGACIATLSGHDGRVPDIAALPYVDGTLLRIGWGLLEPSADPAAPNTIRPPSTVTPSRGSGVVVSEVNAPALRFYGCGFRYVTVWDRIDGRFVLT
mgnify:CR=1 FL=1